MLLTLGSCLQLHLTRLHDYSEEISKLDFLSGALS